MKRIIIIIGTSLVFISVGTLIITLLTIRHGVKERIDIAQAKHGGTAEDALIAYLVDTTNSPRDRTDIAIWTLGQIQSQKALPLLKELYDPASEGGAYHCNHDSALCQYGIFKAIRAIEAKWYPFHSGLNK